MIPLPPVLARILDETPELRRSFPVGGCVRDALLGRLQTDFDVEVFGVGLETLARALSRWGRTDLVGRSFGVVKLRAADGAVYDFGVPRRDSKTAPGHRGFEITLEPELPLRDAAARRDFTINALMYDPRRREILDFFGGRADLEKRILRHTGPAFVEDPLRVLRGMQFAARFGLRAAPETAALCRQIRNGFAELASERVWEEWRKWAGQSETPSAGLEFLSAAGWTEHFPALHAMTGTPQDPEWHPEGDVFRHTGHACDALARLPQWRNADAESRAVFLLAVLLHDTGKPAVTRRETQGGRERIISPGHETESAAAAEAFLRQIHAPNRIVERVLPLVRNHMAHLQTVTDRSVRRLARRLEPESIAGLALVITADAMGRPPRPPETPEWIGALLERAEALKIKDNAPKPVVLGRHLIRLGLEPGPEFGVILERVYEAQLEGAFSDWPGALQWLRRQHIAAADTPPPPPKQA